MKSSSLEKYKKIERNFIEGVRNFFRLKEEINDATIKDARNLLRLQK